MKKFDYDIIIIGSGVAGVAAAQFSASQGLRVALVESGSLGGSSINSLELPLRAASSFSHSYREALRASAFGLSSSSLRFNFPTFKNWLKKSTRSAVSSLKSSLAASGNITILTGLAHFLSPFELSVGKNIITSPKFLIASGSEISDGGIAGLETVACLTPYSWLENLRTSETVAVIGGGSTGCEFAELFSALGCNVTIFELAPRLLPREDEEVGPVIQKSLESTRTVKVLTQTRVVSLAPAKGKTTISYLRGGLRKTATCDAVFLATGKKPALDLGLDNTGVRYTERGITVDKYLQTSCKHIYAAGSCTGSSLPVEYSAYSGALAAANLYTKTRVPAITTGYTRFTGTLPSVASVGTSEEELIRLRTKFSKSVIPLSSTSASMTSDFRLGFIKILVDHGNRLIGATVVAPNADLIIPELSLAVRQHLNIMELASTPVVSSSYSELVRLAARRLIR